MKLGIIANTSKEKVWEVIPELLRWLSKRGVGFLLTSDLVERIHLPGVKLESVDREALAEHCDLVVAFGGDGTILSTAQMVGKSQKPILGVNIGRLGFLAEITTDELFQGMANLLAGKYRVDERIVLEAEVVGDEEGRKFYALNDVVLDKSGFARTIKIETYIGSTDAEEEYLNTYIADGLIISTPTGSTGYSLSAGGPIVFPTTPVVIINPICTHILAARPIIIPDDKIVKIVGHTEHQELLLSLDGQKRCALKSEDAVIVRKADHLVRLVQVCGKSFYHILRTKLNWGENVREKE